MSNQDEQGYEGWSNYPTWCVSLWLSNDYGTYEAVNDVIRDAEGCPLNSVCDSVQEQAEFMAGLEEHQQASLLADLFGWAFGQVDWVEIVQNWVEEMPYRFDDGVLVAVEEVSA